MWWYWSLTLETVEAAGFVEEIDDLLDSVVFLAPVELMEVGLLIVRRGGVSFEKRRGDVG